MNAKLRKMLKQEKGFTLVELLAVIVILGIILAIAIPAIGNIIDNAEDDANEASEELILDAARLADVQDDFESGTTTIQDLIDDGYLEVDPDDLPEGRSNSDTISKADDTGTFSFD
ncbi:prepilin-type N-terminal cleavage/methylation domain-containing protein [Gracilibacillus kekensis]|uniref:Type IV pilus assembly protein PilA n=1 Tax=Gracilibacillus kekensis TaxID=1027249 RepID=A0A1M7NWI3_9BACI|nr:prepilin-type N-terminal cleavage/methylation domain-containing protein [Gracilibacillus kekensis]SHN08477.1 type IV pilus assembly protein PilA [Gracilibacillus kekensis]